MTSTKPLTASERYARFVLGAWNKGEFTRLQSALAEVPTMEPESMAAVEVERMNLIHDLSRSLLASQTLGRGGSSTDRIAALKLVRHLARVE